MSTAAVITISDKGHAGLREDKSGPLLHEMLGEMGFTVPVYRIVPDEQEQIADILRELADNGAVDLIVTTGGTGPAPRDVTPEATRAVIEREMPGLAELLRFEGVKYTPLAVLSRGVAGIRKDTLIINLAGNPKAVREGIEILAPVLPHALQMLKGQNLEHQH
jgi:molybdopterin adenylyltransferase